jgi:protein-S-isoprenylcysteine O-methyltransferase Ste14
MAGSDALAVSSRRSSDVLLLCVTSVELGVLLLLTPALTFPDWIYVLQHVMVLAIALTRRAPAVTDHSLGVSAAVAVSYGYPYAQVIYLQWIPGVSLWPDAGVVLITCGALLSIVSLWTLGRRFGIRPALRGLAVRGTYRLVRHPMYLSYLLSDIGYCLQECNLGTAALVMMGWVSMVYRIESEERIMAHHPDWPAYTHVVRYRLLPGIW